MAALDDLLARIDDPALREALTQEIKPLRGEQELGLVFERHLPEKARLYGHPVRRGLTVELRAQQPSPTWTVLKVTDGTARLRRLDDNRNVILEDHPVEDLVVAREFGDPIYPGLQSAGRVERGKDKPFHTVINAENYHALETLLFAYEGKVDCIFADPPYNSGARDWRYNNDYVDSNDRNRHSKWLSFMEKRLQLAKRLLNPEGSVLIVTIDEKEYLRLGLLLEQVFPSARIQMVSTLINPAAVARPGAFGRSDEYVFFVMQGHAAPRRSRLSREWVSARGRTHKGIPRWDLLRRSGDGASRSDSPGCFYPIYIDPAGPKVAHVGEALPEGESDPESMPGLIPVLPMRKYGEEGRWQWQPSVFRQRLLQGRVRITGNEQNGFVVSILKEGEYKKIRDGEFEVTGHGPDGSIQTATRDADTVMAVPSTQWRIASHDATQYGTRLLVDNFIPGRKFPFPKSLYAVEDMLRFFIGDMPEALVVDFFGGSGTTAHAVMRLNRQDGGRRRSILVTNNEVGADEQKALRGDGLLPGDADWEARGIFEFITKPRLEAAVTGSRQDGTPVPGEYKFTDPFPMADGFEENVEFFRLTYEDRDRVELGASFEAIAPLLWLRAGAQGPRVNQVDPNGWALPKGGRYGVLFVADVWRQFIEALADRDDVTHAFIVTDSDAVFQQVVAELPAGVEPVRLYGGYLTSFAINTGAQP